MLRRCAIAVPFHYFGRQPPFAPQMVFLEDAFVSFDPYCAEQRPLCVGSKCFFCDRAVAVCACEPPFSVAYHCARSHRHARDCKGPVPVSDLGGGTCARKIRFQSILVHAAPCRLTSNWFRSALAAQSFIPREFARSVPRSWSSRWLIFLGALTILMFSR